MRSRRCDRAASSPSYRAQEQATKRASLTEGNRCRASTRGQRLFSSVLPCSRSDCGGCWGDAARPHGCPGAAEQHQALRCWARRGELQGPAGWQQR